MSAAKVRITEPVDAGKDLDYDQKTRAGSNVYRECVSPMPGDTLKGGQNAAVTSAAAALVGSSTPVRGLVLQASFANTARVFVGTAAAQTFELDAGDRLPMGLDDVAKVWVRAASGTQTINWLGVDDA